MSKKDENEELLHCSQNGELQFPFAGLVSFSKTYGTGKNEKIACSDVNIKFTKGSITGLLGPNGAGKTTILKAICGIHYPSSGHVYFQETKTDEKTCFSADDDLSYIRLNTGYVPETPSLDVHLTVIETLSQSALIHGLTKSKASEAVHNAIEYADLSEVLDKKVGTLSKGFMQRTNFARALSFDPSILVLDEFTDGLDPAQIVRMRKVILELSKTKAILLSTHHIEEALSLCSTLYILSKGHIVAQGKIKDILAITHTDTLENAFLQLTGDETK